MRIPTSLLSVLGALLAGFLFFAWHHQLIIITLPSHIPGITECTDPLVKKSAKIWYPHNGSLRHEKSEVLWSDDPATQLKYLVQQWISLINDERPQRKPVLLQATAALQAEPQKNAHSYILSFDRSLFLKESSIKEKLLLIESLLTTIRENIRAIKNITLLAHHEAMTDHHIDLSQPLPIEGFCSIKPTLHQPRVTIDRNNNLPFTIIIDPEGDAHHAGRVIDNTFERGTTLQFAEELKKSLENQLPHARIILTRFAGETVEPLHNAAFANNINTDLYIHIGFYQSTDLLPQIGLYYALYNPATDFWYKKETSLNFIPLHQAYLEHLNDSAWLTESITKNIRKISKNITLNDAQGLPLKALMGLNVPALCIEIGVTNNDAWRPLIHPVANAISATSEMVHSHFSE